MICTICSNQTFKQHNILTERLINEWELSEDEVVYINRQQGLICQNCGSSLRAITLADCIIKHYNYNGNFNYFSQSINKWKLNVLEINAASNLHQYLQHFNKYTFSEYPEIDMQNLPYNDNQFDLVVHSDTLEHVEDSLKGLKECLRVIKPGGALFYTIPIIYGRNTRDRVNLPNSLHGSQDETQGIDYKVFKEYGSDFWAELINAGFTNLSISTIGTLDSVAIKAIKEPYTINYKGSKAPIIIKLKKILKKILKK